MGHFESEEKGVRKTRICEGQNTAKGKIDDDAAINSKLL